MDVITPFEIIIERKDQINVLATTPSDNGKINSFLKQAVSEKIISSSQFESLLALSKRV